MQLRNLGMSFSSIAIGVGLLAWACASSNDTTAPSSATNEPAAVESQTNLIAADGGTPGQHCAGPRIAVCSDGQLAGILHAENRADIDVGQSVVDRLQDPAVRELARRIIADHTRAQAELMRLIQERNIPKIYNSLSTEIYGSAKQEIDSLKAESGGELQNSYVSHEVLDHLEDLGAIDHVLLPSVHDPVLAEYIRHLRVIVTEHELLSNAVLVKIQGACGGD